MANKPEIVSKDQDFRRLWHMEQRTNNFRVLFGGNLGASADTHGIYRFLPSTGSADGPRWPVSVPLKCCWCSPTTQQQGQCTHDNTHGVGSPVPSRRMHGRPRQELAFGQHNFASRPGIQRLHPAPAQAARTIELRDLETQFPPLRPLL